jgi:Ribbon-helix-helix protein, copG family
MMIRMSKSRITVTLSPDLLARVDRHAHGKASRSAVIERWLREGARAEALREEAEATARYYRGLTAEYLDEYEAMSRGLSEAARRVDVDGPRPKRRRR